MGMQHQNTLLEATDHLGRSKKKIAMDHGMIYVRPRIVLIGSELEK